MTQWLRTLMALLVCWCTVPGLQASAERKITKGAVGTKDDPCAGESGGRRVALLVGIQDYDTVSDLQTPRQDVQDVGAVLEGQLGFDVEILRDASAGELRDALLRFQKKLDPCGVGLFWFAGHAMEDAGTNWLATRETRDGSTDAFKGTATPLGLVHAAMGGYLAADGKAQAKRRTDGARTRLLIVDACRDNPYRRLFRGTGPMLDASATPEGTLTVFSTSEGARARDQSGNNSPFAGSFKDRAVSTNGSVYEVFNLVRQDVHQVTKKGDQPQIVDLNDKLLGLFYFRNPVDSTQAYKNRLRDAKDKAQRDAASDWRRVQRASGITQARELREFIDDWTGHTVMVQGEAHDVYVDRLQDAHALQRQLDKRAAQAEADAQADKRIEESQARMANSKPGTTTLQRKKKTRDPILEPMENGYPVGWLGLGPNWMHVSGGTRTFKASHEDEPSDEPTQDASVDYTPSLDEAGVFSLAGPRAEAGARLGPAYARAELMLAFGAGTEREIPPDSGDVYTLRVGFGGCASASLGLMAPYFPVAPFGGYRGVACGMQGDGSTWSGGLVWTTGVAGHGPEYGLRIGSSDWDVGIEARVQHSIAQKFQSTEAAIALVGPNF